MKYKYITAKAVREMLENLPDPMDKNTGAYITKEFTGSTWGSMLVERVNMGGRIEWCIKVRCE